MLKINIQSKLLSGTIKVTSPKDDKLTIEKIKDLCNSGKFCPPYVTCIHFINNDNWIFATDQVRSIPIFFSINDNCLNISIDTNTIATVENKTINRDEFICCGYTTGNTTLIDGVFQLQAGEYLWFNKEKIEVGFYSRYLTNDFFSHDFYCLKLNLKDTFNVVFKTLVENINNRTALIPLSGGYDSRLIAYWLHRLNYKNVICFTYGRKGNIEIENARQTAKILNFKWIFIDYTQLLIKEYLNDGIFKDYYQYMSNNSSMFYMQDYFSVKYLKEMSLIPEDSVFIPGHSGDFLGGSHLYPALGSKMSGNQLAEEIFFKHYKFVITSRSEKIILIQKIKNNIEANYPSHLIYEDWDLRERQSKFIVNSARVYSYFGFDYLLPFWDKRLIMFFKQVPFEFKLYKRLYDNSIIELFEPLNLNFKSELQPSIKEITIQNLKQLLLKKFPYLRKLKGLPKNDPYCYFEITSVMKEDLIKRGISFKEVNNYNGIIVQWYLNHS